MVLLGWERQKDVMVSLDQRQEQEQKCFLAAQSSKTSERGIKLSSCRQLRDYGRSNTLFC